jgi:GH24 family phage-related lysozyme (muramidase)
MMDDKTRRRTAAATIAVALAAPCEGLRQYAYRDVTGLPTICMGSTKGVQMTDFRTVAECKAMLTKEMSDVVSAVDSCRPGLPAPVLAAFADAAYNIGATVACDATKSTAARKLKAGDIAGACNELPKWDKARVAGVMVALPGLTKRRALERDLCLSGVAT